MKRILLILLTPVLLHAQNFRKSLYDSIMQAEVSLNGFNGNVLVAKSGKILFRKSYGYRNYDTKELLDSNSVFELASISKQFTAIGILQLMEAGKLKLTDSLRQFFPELPYGNITIQHLLTHTSGLPAYDDEMAVKWNHGKIAYNRDVISFLSTQKPAIHFKPGEKWEYSNTAFVLLASIIENVSGVSFKDYTDQNIFKPLNMQHTRVYNSRRSSKEIIPDYAYGFVFSDSLKRYMLPDSLITYDFVIYLDGVEGDGIINTTTGDLYKWDRMLKNHALISESTQTKMFSPQSTIDSAAQLYYGYGEMLGTNELGKYIMHTGGWPGYSTILVRFIKDDITIIILSNNESKTNSLSGRLAYVASGKPVVVPYKHIASNMESKGFKKYMGRYLVPNVPMATTFNLFLKDGIIFGRFEKDTADVEYKPESATKLFHSGGKDQQIEFELDSAGKVQKAYYIYGGMKKEITKVN